MKLVGLTGGMGAGKSTVARLFAARGAEVVDADRIAREVVAPGEPALAALADRFGAAILRDDGTLDRAALAALAFADEDAKRALDAITHPHIHERIEARLAALRADADGRIVVLDHPLLVETGRHEDVDVVVVVTAPEELRVERLAARGVARDDARARIRSQASDAHRAAVADHVVTNDRDLAHLEDQVDTIWRVLTAAP